MLEIKKLSVVEWGHEEVEVFIFRYNNNLYGGVFDAEHSSLCGDDE